MNFPINIPVGTQKNGMPIFHKEGTWDSAAETLPTGASADEFADGSWAIDSNPEKVGECSMYNKRTDAWTVAFTLSS